MTTVIGEMCWHRIHLGLVLFKLVVPPLQLGVLVPFLVWGVRFPSRLLLVGTGHNQIFGL
jgi:hypothetical protein